MFVCDESFTSNIQHSKQRSNIRVIEQTRVSSLNSTCCFKFLKVITHIFFWIVQDAKANGVRDFQNFITIFSDRSHNNLKKSAIKIVLGVLPGLSYINCAVKLSKSSIILCFLRYSFATSGLPAIFTSFLVALTTVVGSAVWLTQEPRLNVHLLHGTARFKSRNQIMERKDISNGLERLTISVELDEDGKLPTPFNVNKK